MGIVVNGEVLNSLTIGSKDYREYALQQKRAREQWNEENGTTLCEQQLKSLNG